MNEDAKGIWPEVQERILGMHNTEYVWLRTGQYGAFVECGDICAHTNTTSISLDAAIELLAQADAQAKLQNANVIRMLDTRSSIRVGKYGHYVFYWPRGAIKPRSVSLKKCPFKYLDCSSQDILDWIRQRI
jgi:topoisomerase IA-like protein